GLAREHVERAVAAHRQRTVRIARGRFAGIVTFLVGRGNAVAAGREIRAVADDEIVDAEAAGLRRSTHAEAEVDPFDAFRRRPAPRRAPGRHRTVGRRAAGEGQVTAVWIHPAALPNHPPDAAPPFGSTHSRRGDRQLNRAIAPGAVVAAADD